MIKIPFLDIHTHHPSFRRQQAINRTESNSVIEIYNIDYKELNNYAGFSRDESSQLPILVSAGLHPWDIKPDTAQAALEELEKIACHEKVVFIGECGLDKLRGPAMETQELIFGAQISIANRHQKPLIIHCVKAYDELIRISRQQGIGIPAIIHGFNKGPELARQLSDRGFLLSFGAALLRPGSPASKTLIQIWESRQPFFLETDNSPYSIEDIYLRASYLLKISTEQLKDAIFAFWNNLV